MKQLNCPSCAAPMNLAKADLNWSLACHFCGATAIVPLEYRPKSTEGNRFGEYSASNPLALQQKVTELLSKNKMLEAIKVYHKEMGCGLAEAKNAIDAMRANMPK